VDAPRTINRACHSLLHSTLLLRSCNPDLAYSGLLWTKQYTANRGPRQYSRLSPARPCLRIAQARKTTKHNQDSEAIMQLTRILQSSLFSAILLLAITPLASPSASACTRVLYTGADNLVITGRSMDWNEQMQTDLWALPAGLKRNGAAGPNSIEWTSKYGSVWTAWLTAGASDGMYDLGLVANLLCLAGSDDGEPDPSRAQLSIVAWPQDILYTFATVDEAVKALNKEPFRIVAPTRPNGRQA